MKEQKTGVREVEISIWNRRVGLIARQIKEKTEIEKVKTIEIFKLNWQINKLKKLLTELLCSTQLQYYGYLENP